MPAEKLTRSRFIHIIILLVILTSAFVWRTLSFTNANQAKEMNHTCQYRETCEMNINGRQITITAKESLFTISIISKAQRSLLPVTIEPVFKKILSSEYEMKFINQDPVNETIIIQNNDYKLTIHLPKSS